MTGSINLLPHKILFLLALHRQVFAAQFYKKSGKIKRGVRNENQCHSGNGFIVGIFNCY